VAACVKLSREGNASSFMMPELISENASTCLVFWNFVNMAIRSFFSKQSRDGGFLSSAMLRGVGRQSVADVSAQHIDLIIQSEAATFQKGPNIIYQVVKA
jgi:hypothetical protein